ncbi:MAG: hypothetical protein NC341_06510 [Blautia sp.]|nr:hypothetical protein [Blautia sp.]MCM1200982.1 hypothetical protein [Bacteroides fragilis]
MTKQENGSYRYHFLNREDEAKLVERWGGESMIRDRYPAVWQAIKRTKEYEIDMRTLRSAPGQEEKKRVDVGCPNMRRVNSGVIAGPGKQEERVELSAYMRMRLEDGTYIQNTSGETDDKQESKTWPYAMLSGNIRNATDGMLLADYGRDFYHVNRVDAEMTSAMTYPPTQFSHKKIETFAAYSAVDFNDILHSEEYTVVNPQYADDEGNTFVKEFTVTAPHSSCGNSPIKVLYDRGPFQGESADYSYTNVNKSNNLVKTCLPIAANLSFAHDIAPDDREEILVNDSCFRPKLTYGDPPKNEILYNRGYNDIKKCFVKDGYLLKIDFSKTGTGDYWGVDMSKLNYISQSYEVGRTLELQASFYIRLMNVKYPGSIKAGISIISTDTPPGGSHFYQTIDGYTVYIPKINIRWGCFGEGTRIRMADGSSKPVEKIRSGDIVYTTTGESAVRSVYAGPEKYLIHVCTENGRTLRVTDTHPVVLKGGRSVQAGKLRPEQEVMLGDGGTDRIRWVYECEYNASVYNFELEDGREHTIAAEDILTGEFIAQNQVRADMPRRRNITPQTQALVEQFSAMLKSRGL